MRMDPVDWDGYTVYEEFFRLEASDRSGMACHYVGTMGAIAMIWEGAEATDPPDSEIQRAVEQPNGADRSAVTILRDGRALIVGGTAESGLIMVLQDSEEGPFWNAFSSAEPEIPATAQVEVVAGGQPVNTRQP